MKDTEELIQLIHRSQKGDPEAYGLLVRRFQDMAYGYAYAILNDFQLAEDAAQEAFIEAYHSLPDLREARAFPAWFKRIVFKHCDRLTRKKHLTTMDLDTAAQVASRSPGPSEIVEQRETTNLVQASILALSRQERVVTTLFYINGYSQQDIASFLDVPVKTVKSRLYASRQRLKERMLDMVHDEFRNNALPQSFTHETIERAIAKAREFNQLHQFDESERLLLDILNRVPDHPGALRELNRAIMRGKVYAHGRWDLLSELAERGQVILNAGDDDAVCAELAQTLLTIPAMPPAVKFIEGWIARKGPDLRRTGMLAWARGCMGDYEAAESLWQELLELAAHTRPEERIDRISFTCLASVDCFASAGESARAGRVALQGWKVCRPLGEVPHKDLRGDYDWPGIFLQAGLDYQEITQILLDRYAARTEPEVQATALCLRAYIDEPQAVIVDWLAWAHERMAAQQWRMLDDFRVPMISAFRRRGFPAEQLQLAQATWEMFQDISVPEAQHIREMWNNERFNYFGFFDRQEWEQVRRIAQQAFQEGVIEMGATGLILAAAALSEPTPPELVQRAERNGITSIDSYGLFGWYMTARDAAYTGDARKAFDALRRSVSYWSNPPLAFLDLWENDGVWENLRDATEFTQIFQEKRQRIGPIYGSLHYFPGW